MRTIGDFQTNNNSVPSKTDREFLLEAYGDDVISPVITLVGKESLELNKGAIYTEQGATAIDNKDGDITENIVISGEINTNILGLQHISYSVTDEAGNKAEVVRSIFVKDVKEISEVKNLLIKLFPTAKRLSYITEDQLIIIANAVGLVASKKDLKANTIKRIDEEFKKILL